MTHAEQRPGLKVGLLVNPVAGIGAKVALKGSDGTSRQAEARARGGTPRAQDRAIDFLRTLALKDVVGRVHWYAWGGLGAEILAQLEVPYTSLGHTTQPSRAADTQVCAQAMVQAGVDLVVFAGGDGTAVDLAEAVGEQQLCLGIPAGVKMHSGVFAVSPQAAASIVAGLVDGHLIAAREGEVVDYDEGQGGLGAAAIRTRHFGTLRVPEAGGFLQHTKEGGRESEPLALEEICADVIPRIAARKPLILGPGGTMHAIKIALGVVEPTLRGFDLLDEQGHWQLNVDYRQLEPAADRAYLVMSFTRHQGFLLGRGNLELSQMFLENLDIGRFEVVTTRSKLLSLKGRSLLVDCGSAALDAKFAGLIELTAGYEDRLLYRVDGASLLKSGGQQDG